MTAADEPTDEAEVVAFLNGECPAGGPHVFREHDESPAGPRRVVHCVECGATP